MKLSATLAALIAFSTLPAGVVHADTYDAKTNRLTIDSVQVGNTVYTGVVVTVGTVLSVGGSHPANTTTTTVATSCTLANLQNGFGKIQVGMTLTQVNQTIGCQFDPSKVSRLPNGTVAYSWVWSSTNTSNFGLITVNFTANGTVDRDYLGHAVKYSYGF